MTLIAFGINHNTASIALREAIAFSPASMVQGLGDARSSVGLQEVAILSTCNRTEIYAFGALGVEPMIQWLSTYGSAQPAELKSCHYYLTGLDAVRHMIKVACGLDSMMLGEPQILGQMKSAYAVAGEGGFLGAQLHGAFQHVFSVAKRVRSETAIGQNPVSVAYASVSLAQQIFSDLRQGIALLIGAGETIDLVAKHLADQGIKKIIIANRTLEHARTLADKFAAEAILLADIPQQLHRADIVISSTASQLPLLGKGAVEAALKRRKHKPMFMVDIAVPRDIEPQVGELADVYLYTVDDLQQVIDENIRSREQAALIAEEIIEEGVVSYGQSLRSLDSVSLVKAFREQVGILRDAELDKALQSLHSGVAVEEVLQSLARNLSNKFMHTPTTQCKQASIEGRQDIINSLLYLFKLQDGSNRSESE